LNKKLKDATNEMLR